MQIITIKTKLIKGNILNLQSDLIVPVHKTGNKKGGKAPDWKCG